MDTYSPNAYPPQGHELDGDIARRDAGNTAPSHIPGFPADAVEIVFPPDARVKVGNTTGYPWNTIGQLIMQFPNGKTYTGTGTLVDRQHVLTAAHNVFGNDIGGFAQRVWFIPARDGDDMPYGVVDATRLFITQEYHTLSPADPNRSGGVVDDVTAYTEDYAIVRLKSPLNLPIMGMYAASDAELRDQGARITGYPGDKADGTMWTAAGRLAPPDANLMFYKIDTYRGESGSGVMVDFDQPVGLTITGVHVAGSRKHDTNFAVRLTSGRLKTILGWISSR